MNLIDELGLDYAKTASIGTSSGAELYRVSNDQIDLFVKVGNKDLLRGEYESLKEMSRCVAGICPQPYTYKPLANKAILAVEFLDLGGRATTNLAERLAALHTSPAPDGMYGFHVDNYCGETRQLNTRMSSWSDFFGKNRLLAALEECTRNHGEHRELSREIKLVVDKVVPRLLSEQHTTGISPVLVHGDLWAGNAGTTSRASEGASEGASEAIVFDPCSIYAHNEYELGIMQMFGGFSSVLAEYHMLVPRSDPIDEYEDRILLYELYHHLNHYSIFWHSYRDSSLRICRQLLAKYCGA